MQEVSVHMVANYVSAIKANFVLYSLNSGIMNDPQIKYFIKAMKINRPLVIYNQHIISVSDFKILIKMSSGFPMAQLYKPTFLVVFFGLLHLSNLGPYSKQDFDHTRHLTVGNVLFTKKPIKLKCSKSVQSRDKIHALSLPRLCHST